MTRCLNEEWLELLLHDRAGWRGWWWRLHVRRCAVCRSRLSALREDERLLEEVRRAVATGASSDEVAATRPFLAPGKGS
jgi:hypothetical protein